jgi:hypothetical protein
MQDYDCVNRALLTIGLVIVAVTTVSYIDRKTTEKPKGQNIMSDAFSLQIPADPTWEPMEFDDTLEMDGVYSGKILAEKVQEMNGKTGVRFTLEIADADNAGRKLSKFLQDPRQNDKVMFLWRGLMRSVAGSTDQARQAFTYTPGAFVGHTVFFKVESYIDSKDERRSGIGAWMTASEYQEVIAKGKHRWTPTAGAGQTNRPTGGTPGGSPFGTFPGLPTSVPQPAGTAPVTTAPATNGTSPTPPPTSGFSFPGLPKR